MQTERIIFWQPLDSPHQDDFLEAVAERFAGDVVLGVERPFPAELAAQGWRPPRHRLVKVVDVSRPRDHAMLAAHSGPDSLHVFSGFFSHRLVWEGFRRLAPSRARLAIYSEAPEQRSLTGWLKRLRGRVLAAGWARRIAFVLAIGGVGREFFTAVGFPQGKVVPFGYYVGVPGFSAGTDATAHAGPFRFVSAGQLIRRKGVDMLLEACASLPPSGWRLDVYGDGVERSRLERLVAARGLADRITFRGTIPSVQLQAALATADCAVLPSRFDGWGMLASEALGAGTPVICTDRCGSAALVRHDPAAGHVVPADVKALATACEHALAEGPPDPRRRARAHEVVMTWGSPASGASRLLEASGDLSDHAAPSRTMQPS